ncbi:oxidoreductase [Salinadaptatus halalkaliphilus]|uniref:Oxidoreductase n=1 Tax=Salinadaptatus halalkaliphilus TaxID=2419781 RepID=A0A4S3TM36_9EURY|nr:zinc-binding alcohol dehydrogenase [Salinadaptatus halalkaliphilus]THE65259.1 oxidoreductase [Salinadaptatus halalkaliphilus]
MNDAALAFTAPRTVERRPITVSEPAADEVLVETRVSAISAGTELLVYRDQLPSDLAADETLEAIEGDFSFPVEYGYAAVGEIRAVGSDVDEHWWGETVFGFVPHRTRFCARPESLVRVPPALTDVDAALLPTLETATNLVLDAQPRLGERVVVFGAGVVGLCTLRLLASFPLESLVVVEPLEHRREIAREFGADRAVSPAALAAETNDGHADVTDDAIGDADLAIELAGDPSALDDAIGAVGYDARIVVGSWYGTKRAPIDFGGRFHRDRIELVSSQVSTVDPSLRGRWDTDRRLETALEWVARLETAALVTHRIPFRDAEDAYELLDSGPESALQVLLTYDE